MQIARSSALGAALPLFFFDFVIYDTITTSQLGFLLVAAISFLTLNKKYNSSISISIFNKFLIFSLTIHLFIMILSGMINQVYDVIRGIHSWGGVLLVCMLYILFADKTSKTILLKTAAKVSFISILLFTVILLNFIVLQGYWPATPLLRYEFNKLGPGINRIVNGIIFAAMVITVYAWMARSVKSVNLALVSSLTAVCFSVLIGSRQGIITGLPILLASWLMFRIKINLKSKLLLGIFVVFIFIVGKEIINDYFFVTIQDYIIQRTIDQTEDPSSSILTRGELYKEGLNMFYNYPIFGIGYGQFVVKTGLSAHSGYLRTLVENGIFSLIGFFFLLKMLQIGINKLWRLDKVVFVLLTSSLLLAPFFNGIIPSPMFYLTATVLFMVVEHKTGSFNIEKGSP